MIPAVPVWVAACVFCAFAARAQVPPTMLSSGDLGDLSLEQLSNIVISTVSGRKEPLSGALGSIYVISGEDIRRSGATSLTEALRLAPNLQVARAGALGYAITARGFNGTLANKLLVLMDGRSLYTPTFSGVFWEAHDVLLDDVERIEVISGPGGVLWGANAVNGVINIITRSASATPGGLAGAGAGTREVGAFARYGGRVAGAGFRVYAKRWRWRDQQDERGVDRRDGWDRVQAGWRADWSNGDQSVTLQGDIYEVEGHQTPDPQRPRGAYLLARWERAVGDGDAVRVQAYHDRTSREQQHLDTTDLELQVALAPRGAHRVLWGGGMRYARDRIENSAALALLPANKSLPSWNVFAVDEIALNRDLTLSAGAKIDHNPYTGAEFLPSLRLGWQVTPEHLVWSALSRAVRTPSRFDRELFLPGAPPYLLAGGPAFRSEVARVLELGYRGQVSADASYSATLFFHDLDHVRSVGPGADGAQVENNREGHTRGFETWGSVRLTPAWRVQAGFTHLQTRLRVLEGRTDLQSPANIGSDPRAWWNLRSTLNLDGGWELDVLARRVGTLANRAVPSYSALDLRIGWTSPTVDVSLLLQDLLDRAHIEWGPGAVELQRGAFLKATVRF